MSHGAAGVGAAAPALPGQPEPTAAAALAPVEPSPVGTCLPAEPGDGRGQEKEESEGGSSQGSATDMMEGGTTGRGGCVGQAAALRLRYRETSGLVWRRAPGAERPARGRELSNSELLSKLASKQGDVIELTPQDAEELGLADVRIKDFCWSVVACFTATIRILRQTVEGDVCDLEETAKLLQARGAKVDEDGRLDLRGAVLVSGLQWLSVGATPPAGGIALETPKLAEALSEKAVFSQDEWDAFGIRNLKNNSFIKCGADTYFVPIAAELDLRGLDLRGATCQNAILAGALLDYCDLKGAQAGMAVWSVGYEKPTGGENPSVRWQEWREGKNGKQPIQKASLRHALLQGAGLTEANLEGADLRGAKLEGAELGEANLEGANLEMANLAGANLMDAKLEGANLMAAKLEGAYLGWAKLEGAVLMGAKLAGANLMDANLEGAVLCEANLEGAVLWKANLAGAELGWAKLEGANLDEANLEGANLQAAKLEGAELGRANLAGAILKQANLAGANLEGAKLKDTVLTGANLKGVKGRPELDIQGLDLTGVILEGVDICNANLQGSNLTRAKLEGAKLKEANLKGANLEEANLEGADLEDAKLEGANLGGAKLKDTVLTGANLKGVKGRPELDLQGMDLTGVILEGVDICKANLRGSNLTDADLREADLTDADLIDADLKGAVLVRCVFSKTKLSAKTDMSDAVFSSFAPRGRKTTSRRSALPAAAAESCCLAMQNTLGNLCRAGGQDEGGDEEGGSDDDSIGSGEEEAEDGEDEEEWESEVKQELNSLIEALSCAAAVVDRAMQGATEVMKERVLDPCRKLLKTVAEARIRAKVLKVGNSRLLESQRKKWVAALQPEVEGCIHDVLKDAIKWLFDKVLPLVYTEIKRDIKEAQNHLGEPDNYEAFCKSLNLQKEGQGNLRPKKEKGDAKGEELEQQQQGGRDPVASSLTQAFRIRTPVPTFEWKRASAVAASPTETADAAQEAVAGNAASQCSHLALIMTRQLLDQFLNVMDPKRGSLQGLRRQAEGHAKKLAQETSGKILESLWSAMRRHGRVVDLEAGQVAQERERGRSNRFRSAAAAVMAANRLQAGGSAGGAAEAVDVSSCLQALAEVSDSFEQVLVEDGIQGLVKNLLRGSAESAVSVLSGSTTGMLKAVALYEDLLTTRLEKASPSLKRLMGSDSVRSIAIKRMLRSTTAYTMRSSGFAAYFDMIKAAATYTRRQLAREEQDLLYVIEQIKKLQELATTPETFRDVVDTWVSLLDLIPQISSQRGLAVLQCLSSDKKLLSAIGAGRALRDTVGDKPPTSIVSRINKDAGQRIRTHAYKFLRALEQEITIVRRTKDHQARGVALIGSALISVFITIGGVVGRLYYDAIQQPEGSMLLWLIPVVFIGVLIGCVLCSYATYRYLKRPASASTAGYQLLPR